MATRTVSIPAAAGEEPFSNPARWLVLGAPLVAVLAGMAAEWLDFRALRVPLLLMVGFGVLATAHRLIGARAGGTLAPASWRPFALAVLLGATTWAAAEATYTIIHVALGHQFHADRFGPQWSQAVGLIAAHGLFLGAPTGAVAGLMLQAPSLLRRFRRGR